MRGGAGRRAQPQERVSPIDLIPTGKSRNTCMMFDILPSSVRAGRREGLHVALRQARVLLAHRSRPSLNVTNRLVRP